MTRYTATRSRRAPAQRSMVGHRAVWAAAIVATVLMLALAGCGGARHQGQNNAGVTQQQNGGGNGATNTGGSNTATNSNPSAVAAVDSLDSQSQNASSSIDGTYNDANVNYSTQENEQQP